MDAMNNVTPQAEERRSGVVDYYAMLQDEKMNLDMLFKNALEIAKTNHFSDNRMDNLLKNQNTSVEATIRIAYSALRNILLSHGSNPKKFLFFESKAYKKDYKNLLNTLIELKSAMEFEGEAVVNERARTLRNMVNAMNQKYEVDSEKQNMLNALSEYILDTVKNAVEVQKITDRYENYDSDMKTLIEMNQYLTELIGDAYSQKAVDFCQQVAKRIMNYRENFEAGVISSLDLRKAKDIIVDEWSKSRKLTGKKIDVEVTLNKNDKLSRAPLFGDIKQQVESFFKQVDIIKDQFVQDRNQAVDAYNNLINDFVKLQKEYWELKRAYEGGDISKQEYEQRGVSIKASVTDLNKKIKSAENNMKAKLLEFSAIDNTFELMNRIMASEKSLASKFRLASFVDAFEEDEEINYAKILDAFSGDSYSKKVSSEAVLKHLNSYIEKQNRKIARAVGMGKLAEEMNKDIEAANAEKAKQYDAQKSTALENPLKNAEADIKDLDNLFGPESQNVAPVAIDAEGDLDSFFGEDPSMNKRRVNPSTAEGDQ